MHQQTQNPHSKRTAARQSLLSLYCCPCSGAAAAAAAAARCCRLQATLCVGQSRFWQSGPQYRAPLQPLHLSTAPAAPHAAQASARRGGSLEAACSAAAAAGPRATAVTPGVAAAATSSPASRSTPATASSAPTRAAAHSSRWPAGPACWASRSSTARAQNASFSAHSASGGRSSGRAVRSAPSQASRSGRHLDVRVDAQGLGRGGVQREGFGWVGVGGGRGPSSHQPAQRTDSRGKRPQQLRDAALAAAAPDVGRYRIQQRGDGGAPVGEQGGALAVNGRRLPLTRVGSKRSAQAGN